MINNKIHYSIEHNKATPLNFHLFYIPPLPPLGKNTLNIKY